MRLWETVTRADQTGFPGGENTGKSGENTVVGGMG